MDYFRLQRGQQGVQRAADAAGKSPLRIVRRLPLATRALEEEVEYVSPCQEIEFFDRFGPRPSEYLNSGRS